MSELTKENINTFLKAVDQFCEHIYDETEIFIGNPFDLIDIDMYEIPSNCYFISDNHIDMGTMFKIEDDDLKRMYYNFIENFPDRVFRGKKWSNRN